MAEMSAKSKATAQKADLSKFRNSKLTLLLSNALRGNSHTSVIVTLSPSLVHFDTSLSSIKFAMEVKGIKIQATSSAGKDPQAVIKKLEQEIEGLKQKLAAAPTSADETNTPGGVDPALESENKRLQKEVAELKAKPAVDPALETENKRLQGEVAELKAKPAVDPALETENKRLQEEVAELKAKLALGSQAPSMLHEGNGDVSEKDKGAKTAEPERSSYAGGADSLNMFPEILDQMRRALDLSRKNVERMDQWMLKHDSK
eukprot:TRINITY_DN18034_c0_g2_i1.p1 TRINITY_DN18034_c0_g2~~TRINITY_DN18034_c0_g2_i1.p1  ORF type:complete len:267 (-),score=79.24 TRINITY_DN18034_c0_g2_i1:106-885(-)